MDEFITYEDAFAKTAVDWLFQIKQWLSLARIFGGELNPWDHEAFFDIPAYMREGWDA